jgi:7-cyano-7-deazaguanine reductase
VVKRKRTDKFRLLGHSDVELPASPAEARLETFPNPAPQRNYRIHFETDDFTSICPVTGQPDFARIDIDYVPDRLCVESKSLKFYLAAYRNERAFNEAVTNRLLDDFRESLCATRGNRYRAILCTRWNRVDSPRRISAQELRPATKA